MDEIKQLEEEIRSGTGISRDDEADEQMFKDLAAVDGFKEYLFKTLARDMKRHFIAQSESHDFVKGAYFRTDWLYKKLLKYSE